MLQEALKEFFGERLSADWAAECLGDLVQNPANVNLVVDIAVEYTEAMGGWEKVLAVLEKAPNAAQIEFAYLARRIATSEEKEEHYRYIVAASKCQQFQVRAVSRRAARSA
jgi:alkyl sulfatase BDS1-like metallo-beta-lactamase superfamily hydrolase